MFPVLRSPTPHPKTPPWLLLMGCLITLTSCRLPKADAEANNRAAGQQAQPAAVNVAIAPLFKNQSEKRLDKSQFINH
jgi:hypothetical protein